MGKTGSLGPDPSLLRLRPNLTFQCGIVRHLVSDLLETLIPFDNENKYESFHNEKWLPFSLFEDIVVLWSFATE